MSGWGRLFMRKTSQSVLFRTTGSSIIVFFFLSKCTLAGESHVVFGYVLTTAEVFLFRHSFNFVATSDRYG